MIARHVATQVACRQQNRGLVPANDWPLTADDLQRRAAWLRAIDRDGPDDTRRSQCFVGSDHFLLEDYDMNIEVRRSLGLEPKRACLVEPRAPRYREHARVQCWFRRRMVTGLVLVGG
ncbi:hypothetical protein ISCGN_024055 [Ixodes scapularis]